MAKFYRVVKDHPIWEVGAILKEVNSGRFEPISDIWDKFDSDDGTPFGTVAVVAEKSDWFERVYESSILGKASYVTKEKAKQIANDLFNK